MNKIAYIVLYFGKLPEFFKLFLVSCGKNPSVNWILFTDDTRKFIYPENVSVNYCKFEEIIGKIQSVYDFKISLKKPYKICDFRPAYGEIFSDILKGYDFWGYCDIDVIWGNIRNFITDDILNNYDKVGFQGHSTLYRNTSKNNKIYRQQKNLKDIFSDESSYLFDENIITKLYDKLGIKQYKKTIFAHPCALRYNLFLKHLPEADDFKNKYQVMEWNKGTLWRVYLHNKKIYKEEFMYFHIFQRSMKICTNNLEHFLILPHKICDFQTTDEKFLKKYNRNNMFLYYMDLFYRKRNKFKNLSHVAYVLSKRREVKKEMRKR